MPVAPEDLSIGITQTVVRFSGAATTNWLKIEKAGNCQKKPGTTKKIGGDFLEKSLPLFKVSRPFRPFPASMFAPLMVG